MNTAKDISMTPSWHAQMVTRVQKQEPEVPWFLEDKLECYKFCRQHGLPVVDILRVFDSPDGIDLTGLPESFVLKPTRQSSMKGVMLLTALEAGYRDLLRSRELTVEQIIREQSTLWNATVARDKKLIVEPKIVDIGEYPVPRDFKVYAFRGSLQLILEIDRNTSPVTVTWFDGDFEPLAPGKVLANPKYIRSGRNPRPTMWRDIRELAIAVSAAVPTPFARVDAYITPSGPKVGEITLTPGGPYFKVHYEFSEEFDQHLGAAWDWAAGSRQENFSS